MTREEIINGLKMSIDLMLFDPNTGEVKEPHQLNDIDRTSYEAFKGAMEILAQPQRMRGRWIDRNGNIVSPFWERYECSECGARSDNTNYCPNCGAQMEGTR
jgi:rubrerythrin